MKIKQVASNMTQLTNGKFVVLFSYETAVAVVNTDTNKVFQTNQKYSKTTSSHINKWYKMIVSGYVKEVRLVALNPHMVSQTEIDGMAQ